MLHLRGKPGGTILYDEGNVQMLNTSTLFTMSSCVYPSWHPNGNIIAFSVVIRKPFSGSCAITLEEGIRT